MSEGSASQFQMNYLNGTGGGPLCVLIPYATPAVAKTALHGCDTRNLIKITGPKKLGALSSAQFSIAIERYGLPASLAATAAAVPIATAATTTTAASSSRAFLSLIDAERAAAHVLAIEVLDSARGIGAGHLHKAEAAWPAGLAIGDEAHRFHGSMLAKQVAHFAFSGGKRQVADVDFRHDGIKLLQAGTCEAFA